MSQLTSILLDDPSKINERIQSLENERLNLSKKLTSTNIDDDIKFKANELSNLLQLALRNSDLDTIDALILSYGEIPSLIKARSVLNKKLQDSIKQEQLSKYNDISDQLNTVEGFDLELLQNIKEKISALSDEELLDSVKAQYQTIIETLKPHLQNVFKDSLSSTNWLTSKVPTYTFNSFQDLINLQSLSFDGIDSLWAFDIISHNFQISFDYHFNSTKETNRIDRPELFYTYHLKYLETNLVKIAQTWSLSETKLRSKYSHSEFITSSLKPIYTKFQQFLNILRSNDDSESVDILIHLIKETIQYDIRLINEFYYDPQDDGKWAGLFSQFQYQDLEKWLLRELKINDSNYETIVNSNDVFQIDRTSVDKYELKPTVSSIKLKYLLENLTKQFSLIFQQNYENIPSLDKFKLKFFSKIYLQILQSYLKRLKDGFDAFNELFNSAKIVIHKSNSREIDISGVLGLERIIKIYTSVKSISNTLSYWNQEFIFIELNQLFNRYSNSNSSSLFDSILSDYENLESKSWELLKKFITKSLNNVFKNYISINKWGFHNDDNDTISLSNQLIPVISLVETYTSFLKELITKNQLILIHNHISLEASTIFLQSIIKSNQFDQRGIEQITLDIGTVWSTLKLNESFPYYFKVIEALKLMNLKQLEINQFTSVTLSQYAKLGDYSELRSILNIEYLRDSDILDVLLRIH